MKTLEKEEVVEGNKRIAKFMGYEYVPFNNEYAFKPGWWKVDTPVAIKTHPASHKFSHNYYLCRRYHEIRYYNSWDWLVPVVDKIYKDYRELISSNMYFNTTYDAMGQSLSSRNRVRLFQVINRFLIKANDG